MEAMMGRNCMALTVFPMPDTLLGPILAVPCVKIAGDGNLCVELRSHAVK